MTNLHYVELWKMQSELFWRTVYAIPFIGVAVIAGWYAAESGGDGDLGNYLLLAGIAVMVVQMMILARMAQYMNAFRRAADSLIPSVPPSSVGFSGFQIGVSVPIIIAMLLSVMLFLDPGSRSSPVEACS